MLIEKWQPAIAGSNLPAHREAVGRNAFVLYGAAGPNEVDPAPALVQTGGGLDAHLLQEIFIVITGERVGVVRQRVGFALVTGGLPERRAESLRRALRQVRC